MILALSRFKVANGLEDCVARAFLDRQRLVESAEGFLGLEVFTDSNDASVLYLSARWTTESAFRQWHAIEAHHTSHKGIPKGLKPPAFGCENAFEAEQWIRSRGRRRARDEHQLHIGCERRVGYRNVGCFIKKENS